MEVTRECKDIWGYLHDMEDTLDAVHFKEALVASEVMHGWLGSRNVSRQMETLLDVTVVAVYILDAKREGMYNFMNFLEKKVERCRNFICPHTYRRRSSPLIGHGSHYLSIVRWLIETRWMLQGGRERRWQVRGRATCLRDRMILALFSNTSCNFAKDIFGWMLVQLSIPFGGI